MARRKRRPASPPVTLLHSKWAEQSLGILLWDGPVLARPQQRDGARSSDAQVVGGRLRRRRLFAADRECLRRRLAGQGRRPIISRLRGRPTTEGGAAYACRSSNLHGTWIDPRPLGCGDAARLRGSLEVLCELTVVLVRTWVYCTTAYRKWVLGTVTLFE